MTPAALVVLAAELQQRIWSREIRPRNRVQLRRRIPESGPPPDDRQQIHPDISDGNEGVSGY